jgi:hypothetical protein
MKMMETMMSFMMGRISKEHKEEMMEAMMPKMIGDMSAEDRMHMMTTMMPKMMAGMDMSDMMPKMMSQMMGGGGMPDAGADGMAMPMGGMMTQMMPHCMKIAAKQAPAEQRQEAIVDLVAAMLEAGCETVDIDERSALLEKLQSRIEAMKTA